MHCKKKGHYKRDCPDFLKSLLRKSKDEITFVDESLYLDYSVNIWWIDSGTTVHVPNYLQMFHTRRDLPRGQRKIIVANWKEDEVKAIGDLSLLLDNGYVLNLRDVLFVPSLRRNLISISCLDDENIHYYFGDQKCLIRHDNKDVGLAIRRDKFYFLSQYDVVNALDTHDSETDTNNSKKIKRNANGDGESSSKLWHYHLGHISRGG